MESVRYVLALLLVVALPPAIVWWYIVHPFVGFWRRVGPRGTLTVLGLFMAGSMVGLYVIRDALLGRDLGLQPALAVTGVVLLAAAVRLGIARKRFLTTRILAGVPELESDPDARGTLLDQGPYAVIRHPRYVEVVLGTFGYAAVANHAGAWIVALLSLPALHLVVLLEERELRERFGDAYRDYATRVPRYLPRLGRPAAGR